jgi:hypothetical protein
MKYLKLFESFEDIDEICRKYNINYTINTDGSIDVNDSVYLHNKGLTKLPIKFNKINGYFDCSRNELASFEGSPVEVNGHFYCGVNKLESFEYLTRIIRGNFYCDNNNIKTFEYFPSFIKYNFYCYSNPIYEVWKLFEDWTKIELLNDFDIFRDEDTDEPAIVMDRLNDFLLTIGEDPIKKVYRYKNI